MLKKAALKKAKERANLPRHPDKFVEAVEHIVNTRSPRKKAALQEKGILTPSSRKKMVMMGHIAGNVKRRIS